ncbi:MAG: hypothetical protein NVSMB18_22070 [Acetobacteraceae bacterium]
MSSEAKAAVRIDDLFALSSSSERLLSVAKRLNEAAQSTSDDRIRQTLIESVRDVLASIDANNTVVGKADVRTNRLAEF